MKKRLFLIILLFVLMTCLSGCGSSSGSSSSSSGRNWSEQNSIDCQRKSDTYYKCSWNMIEDRCTCKAR